MEALVRECNLPAVIVSPTTPVGPRDIKPTATGRIIVDAVSGRMPAYVDTGLNVVHVHDVAQGHRLALERGEIGERYILGGTNMSLREILEALALIGGQRPPLFSHAPFGRRTGGMLFGSLFKDIRKRRTARDP